MSRQLRSWFFTKTGDTQINGWWQRFIGGGISKVTQSTMQNLCDSAAFHSEISSAAQVDSTTGLIAKQGLVILASDTSAIAGDDTALGSTGGALVTQPHQLPDVKATTSQTIGTFTGEPITVTKDNTVTTRSSYNLSFTAGLINYLNTLPTVSAMSTAIQLGINIFSATLARVATTGSYNDLSNKPSIPADQIQSDWTQTDNTQPDYIKDKPTLATVATSGAYGDLSGTPVISSTKGTWTDGGVNFDYYIDIVGGVKWMVINVIGGNITQPVTTTTIFDITTQLAGHTIDSQAQMAPLVCYDTNTSAFVPGVLIRSSGTHSIDFNYSLSFSTHTYNFYGQIKLKIN